MVTHSDLLIEDIMIEIVRPSPLMIVISVENLAVIHKCNGKYGYGIQTH